MTGLVNSISSDCHTHMHDRLTQPLPNEVAYAQQSKVTLAFDSGDIVCPRHLAWCICNMYLCLGFVDLRAPHWNGNNHGRKIVYVRQT